MLGLIYLLTALQIYCKDAHYNFYGENFKPLHEWADEILDPLQDFIDEIKENAFLAREAKVPRGVDINAKAADFVPVALGSNEEILKNLLALISMAHDKANSIEESVGIEDLLGRIDAHLMKQMALLNLAITFKKDE